MWGIATFIASWVSAAADPASGPLPHADDAGEIPCGGPLTREAVEWIAFAPERTSSAIAAVEVARAAFAVASWRRAHGRYPSDVGELTARTDDDAEPAGAQGTSPAWDLLGYAHISPDPSRGENGDGAVIWARHAYGPEVDAETWAGETSGGNPQLILLGIARERYPTDTAEIERMFDEEP